MSTLPPPPPAPFGGALATLPPPVPGRATAAMVLGIVGLAAGFTGVALLCAVAANVLGSLALHEIDGSAGRLGGRGRAVAGIACAVSALVVWITLFAVLAATGAIE